jgi:lipopolysaccharide transport system ATP-binding protein
VDFAGVAKYLDTPTKRYSSGMTVRLGFAIAAHLEPEILVVDEVLAVGDAEFQKKAIGKMQDVSTNDGRTVLFVSHNMASIQKLCNRGIMLQNGFITLDNNIQNVTKEYIKSNIQAKSTKLDTLPRKSGYGQAAKFVSAEILNNEKKSTGNLRFGEPFKIKLKIEAFDNAQNLNVGVRFENTSDVYISSCLSGDVNKYYTINEKSKTTVELTFNNFTLTPGDYKITLSLRVGKVFIDQLTDVLPFSVDEMPYDPNNIHNGAWGLISYKPEWN